MMLVGRVRMLRTEDGWFECLVIGSHEKMCKPYKSCRVRMLRTGKMVGLSVW